MPLFDLNLSMIIRENHIQLSICVQEAKENVNISSYLSKGALFWGAFFAILWRLALV